MIAPSVESKKEGCAAKNPKQRGINTRYPNIFAAYKLIRSGGNELYDGRFNGQ